MPYIVKARREPVRAHGPDNPGELNYALTAAIQEDPLGADGGRLWEIVEGYLVGKDPSYALFNEVIGAIRCAQLEHKRRRWVGSWALKRLERLLYREYVGPYEDQAILKNGDVI